MRIADMTWQEYDDEIGRRIVVLPIGSIDGHGPHLPLSADTIISDHLARQLEERLDVLVLPPLTYGLATDPAASGGRFPGVTNVRAATFTNLVLDVLRASYRHGARRFVLLDSHKVNLGALREAAELFADTAPQARIMAVTWWDVVTEESRNAIAAETGVARHDDHHAAMVETSLVMHAAPHLVREELLADDEIPRRARYFVLPVPQDLRTKTGVVYRAAAASPAIGARLMTEIVTNLVAAVARELGESPQEVLP
ncbi:creatininase family protein [Actinomadura coerulea]|uniref:Creatinine amidohydrolase n=1 Tax=Actinomadura coerulea TaxID=46159 RepID=A0A7X0G4H7_9ACTN|nr:creatininase family protein [Actinomadura coerulea]MBB6399305.1 creatinine amidohydrolase [Actinomadura coerulea]GGQ27966.1 creatinine amidohydrolase [Actinomadura coerulea]